MAVRVSDGVSSDPEIEVTIEFLFTTLKVMATGFDCVEALGACRRFVERLCFTERRRIIVSCIEKHDRCVIQLLQVLMRVEESFAWRSVCKVDKRIR